MLCVSTSKQEEEVLAVYDSAVVITASCGVKRNTVYKYREREGSGVQHRFIMATNKISRWD